MKVSFIQEYCIVCVVFVSVVQVSVAVGLCFVVALIMVLNLNTVYGLTSFRVRDGVRAGVW